ncbi:MAG: hypothetical protein WCO00_13480 [Rhodospirillaceae bacterium]
MNGSEHEWLNQACHELSLAFANPTLDKDAALKMLSLMKASMLLHYAEEENIMKTTGYQNMGSHKRSHDYFIFEVSTLIEMVSSDAPALSASIWPDLKKKLDNHLKTHDELLTGYIEGQFQRSAG